MTDEPRCPDCDAAPVPDPTCAWCDAIRREAEEHRALLARHAVRDGDPARLPMTLDEAAARVSAFLGSPVLAGDQFDPSDALEAVTWWYVPYCWIGCCGFAVEKRTGEVHQMGSGAGLETYLWAQASGLLSEYADLVIDVVHDRVASVAVLRQVVAVPSGDHYPLHGPGSEPLAAMLASAPVRFHAQRVGLWLRELREGVEAGAFSCHMEPPTAAPRPAGAWHVVLDVGAIRAVAEDRGLCGRLLDGVHARRLEIDATWGLRQLAIDRDLDEVPSARPLTAPQRAAVRERNRRTRQRERVPCRVVGDEAAPRDEATELAATFAAGGATTLVSTDAAAAAAKVAAGVRIVDLAALIAHVGDAPD